MSEELEAVEAEATTEDVTVLSIAGVEVRVKPVREWRTSGIRSMRDGDFDSWAETALVEDDVDKWLDADPTLGEVEDFFEAWSKATGEDAGKPRRSSRSSKTRRKR